MVVNMVTQSFLLIKKHKRDKTIGSMLSKDLRKQYSKRHLRVRKGDTVKVMRGEFKGIEGKVEKVNTERGALSIEGIQREKIRGGNVKIQIHSSNVMITSIYSDDKYRVAKLKGETTKNEEIKEKKVGKVKENEAKKSRKSKGEKAKVE